ncbi:MAG TPA: beta-ketoacyl-ACP synthase II [Pirellulaceae bacterium]|nr:beta-ketoacyl-ACP synthase II [Pirellulaceae bacterium]HMO90636.1 beta-ketoacyl-ACP synthase II [Pirellulaceae bacterium]HMP67785.1 beta-ketoacyl-ACP synthase II [Pirellulaceae bacterium]
MSRRVVVTGMGIVTSLSCSVDECWRKVAAGESGIHEIKLFDVSDFDVRFGGDIYDWDPASYIDAKELKRIDRFTQFALVAGTDAVDDSGIDFNKEDSFLCGVVLGSGIGGLSTIEQQLTRLITKGPDKVSPLTIPKLMLNAAGSNISIKYGIRGTNYTVATACASATNAMGDSLNLIRSGDADCLITGGTEAAMTRMGLSAFQNMRALSSRNDDPRGASRPFDVDRDGFVFSEGAGIVIFEEYEHAKKRGAKIYAEILGYGTSGDAGHITQPDENGTGAARAMELALRDAKLNADQIDYINAHGTSTPLGDVAETNAVKSVFGNHARKLSISSTKSQLGHTLGASGGLELIISICAMNQGLVPPTINLHNPDPQCDLNYTPNTAQERELNFCMSNSFGFGGHNASIVVGKLR